jgi:hypothetical protein
VILFQVLETNDVPDSVASRAFVKRAKAVADKTDPPVTKDVQASEPAPVSTASASRSSFVSSVPVSTKF